MKKINLSATVFLLLVLNSPSYGSDDRLETPEDSVGYVYAEQTTHVVLSSKDNNRLICQDSITDIVFSSEKGNGVEAKILGKNAFVKFKVASTFDGKRLYMNELSEFYVICGGEIYTLIAHPRKVTAQTIMLMRSKHRDIEDNLKAFAGMPVEKRVINLIKAVLTNKIPESWEVKKQMKKVYAFKDIDTVIAREIKVEGIGLRLREVSCALREGSSDETTVDLREADFLIPAFSEKPIAVAIEKNKLAKGEYARAFIVDRVNSR